MILQSIADYLVSLGVVSASEVYLSSAVVIPDVNTTIVLMREYGGDAPMFVHSTDDIGIEVPRVQVLVRASSYQAARLKAESIYRHLARVTNMTLGSQQYLRIEPLQNPFDLGPDGRGRAQVVFNIEARKGVTV